MNFDKYFNKIIENNKIDGGWLFLCIDIEKSFKKALELARLITNPYLIYIIADSDSLQEIKENYQIFEPGIKSIIDIQKLLYLSTEEKKVLIIKSVESLSLEAQNALLKITEEPPPRTSFFFISNDENSILPTLLSRLRIIRIPLLPKDGFYRKRISNDLKKGIEQKNLLPIYLKEFLGENEIDFMENLIVLFRDQMLNKFNIVNYKYTDAKGEVSGDIIKMAIKALEGMKYANLNPRLQIENILLNIFKKDF
ncbi:MAG: hypothetical protein N2692_01585 [Patescibacteria group bacterium]|jgi:DNA polymerase III delta prime subunit|nr:hypothetical protein [Patescibacteria group bacterium]